jgi:hypothetical protein
MRISNGSPGIDLLNRVNSSGVKEIRYCRICWNTQGWQRPTGEAAKLEGTSYVSEHGFGHEEWLLNYGWLIDGYKYGFIQPIQYLRRYSSPDEIFEIILYTISPMGERLFVGRIGTCELVGEEEAAKVYRHYERQGWLDEMVDDLKRLNIDPKPIRTAGVSPISITNFRFRPEDVEILKPFIPVDKSHKINRINRYRPLREDNQNEWSRISNKGKESIGENLSFRHGKLKRTELRKRAAQEGIYFDPGHDRIQNSLFEKLVDIYGESNVGYEDRAVDIVVRNKAEIVFYEVKTATTAKQCIRLAIGQLLEYSHWPNISKAQKLVIVGPAHP